MNQDGCDHKIEHVIRGRQSAFGKEWKHQNLLTQAAFVRIIANPAFSPDAVTPQEATKLLSERTGCPTLPRIPSKPMLHLCMALVGRPHQRDQHIDIQQDGRHSCSASSSRTLFALTRGDSSDHQTGPRKPTSRKKTEKEGRSEITEMRPRFNRTEDS